MCSIAWGNGRASVWRHEPQSDKKATQGCWPPVALNMKREWI